MEPKGDSGKVLIVVGLVPPFGGGTPPLTSTSIDQNGLPICPSWHSSFEIHGCDLRPNLRGDPHLREVYVDSVDGRNMAAYWGLSGGHAVLLLSGRKEVLKGQDSLTSKDHDPRDSFSSLVIH